MLKRGGSVRQQADSGRGWHLKRAGCFFYYTLSSKRSQVDKQLLPNTHHTLKTNQMSKLRRCKNGQLCPCGVPYSIWPEHLGRVLSWESEQNSYPTEKGNGFRGKSGFTAELQTCLLDPTNLYCPGPLHQRGHP